MMFLGNDTVINRVMYASLCIWKTLASLSCKLSWRNKLHFIKQYNFKQKTIMEILKNSPYYRFCLIQCTLRLTRTS